METDNMSDFTVQGGLGIYTGHASIAELQGIYVSGGSEGGCGRLEPE